MPGRPYEYTSCTAGPGKGLGLLNIPHAQGQPALTIAFLVLV